MSIIAFQGELGAYSHLACANFAPDYEPRPYASFYDVFDALQSGTADTAMVPVENSIAGRVSEIHKLLPASRLHIVAEHFLPIHHQLLANKGANLASIKTVSSHIMAIDQCRSFLHTHGFTINVAGDTAGAAKYISEGDHTMAAIASSLAAELYDLNIIAPNIEDDPTNVTRFFRLSSQPQRYNVDEECLLTSLVFEVRSIPSALFKSLSGFATNSVNLTKLESYQPRGDFHAVAFFVDVEGAPGQAAFDRAMQDLRYYSEKVTVLGTYKMSEFRQGHQ